MAHPPLITDADRGSFLRVVQDVSVTAGLSPYAAYSWPSTLDSGAVLLAHYFDRAPTTAFHLLVWLEPDEPLLAVSIHDYDHSETTNRVSEILDLLALRLNRALPAYELSTRGHTMRNLPP